MKWEYKIIRHKTKTIEEFENLLNEYGQDGWEVIEIMKFDVLFKRQLPRTA